MATPLSLQVIRSSIEAGAVAIRRVQRLRPAGGSGDKIFPPTYEGGTYALEQRIINGHRVPCVLLDSVQSQANRIELALKDACYRGKDQVADIPVVTVDFTQEGLPDVGEITSLDAPHRLADAILRDSLNGDRKFRESEEGQIIDSATNSNATGLFGLCPTALILGLWDSAAAVRRRGPGVKFQRVLVSEIIGIDVETGVRPSSRLDPLGIERETKEIYMTADGSDWTIDPAKAAKDKGKPLRWKDGKPSQINHGNVTPSLKNDKGQPHHGGVSLGYAQQTVVISLAALRRLRFPDDAGAVGVERDLVGRSALAILAIAGAQLSIDQGCDLRSRCLLVPDADVSSLWEVVDAQGQSKSFSASEPTTLLDAAIESLAAVGLPAWRRQPLVLRPRPELAELVRINRAAATDTPPED